MYYYNYYIYYFYSKAIFFNWNICNFNFKQEILELQIEKS